MDDSVRRGDVLWTREGEDRVPQLYILVPMDIIEALGEAPVLTMGFDRQLRLYSLDGYVHHAKKLIEIHKSTGERLLPMPYPARFKSHWLEVPHQLMAGCNIESKVYMHSDRGGRYMVLTGEPPTSIKKDLSWNVDFLFADDEMYWLKLPEIVYADLHRKKYSPGGEYRALITIGVDERRKPEFRIWDGRYVALADELSRELERLTTHGHIKGFYRADVNGCGVWVPHWILNFAEIDEEATIHYISEGVYSVKRREKYADTEDDDIDFDE